MVAIGSGSGRVLYAASGCARTRLLLPLTVSSSRHHQQQQASLIAAAAAPDSSSDSLYRDDEIEEYEELLRRKKEARQQAIADAVKKRKLRPTGKQPLPSTAAAAAAAGEAGASSSNAGASSTQGPTGVRFAARPRVMPSLLKQQQQQPDQSHQSATSEPAAAPAVTVAAADSRSSLPSITPASSDDLPPDNVLKEMLDELLQGNLDLDDNHDLDDDDDDLDDDHDASDDGGFDRVKTEQQQQQQSLSAAPQRRKTPAEIRAAAAARRAAQKQTMLRRKQASQITTSSSSSSRVTSASKYNDKMLAKLAANDPKAAALQQMLEVLKDDDDNDSNVTDESSSYVTTGDEDLNWEALGQYEQLEQYLDGLHKQQLVPTRPALTTDKAAAAAAAAIPPAVTATAAASSSSSSPVEAAVPKKLKRVKAGTAARQFEKELDELERFANLFEALEKGTAGSGGSSSSALRQPGPAAAATADDDDAGEALISAMLGQDWEAELLDELASVLDDEEDAAADGSSRQQQQQRSLTHAAATSDQQEVHVEDDEDEPWADEVTGLLLGLVSMSHEKYVKAPIPLPNPDHISEDQRCDAFWSSPWALFVVDDSAQYCLEYVNAAASELLDGSYLNLFGQAAYERVAETMDAQSDWAYAVNRVEESAAHCARLPQLMLTDTAGRNVLAKDVVMWRVDSLEDTAVGMAVMVKNWERQ